jgi:hypothetical protein
MFDLDPASPEAECIVLLIDEVTCHVASLGWEEVDSLLAQHASAPLPAWDTIAGIRKWLAERLGQSSQIQAAKGAGDLGASLSPQQRSGWQADKEAEWARKWSLSNWKKRAGGYASQEQASFVNPVLKEWGCAEQLRDELLGNQQYQAMMADDRRVLPNFSQVCEPKCGLFGLLQIRVFCSL